MRDISDSARGVEELYAETVQQCLAIESRLSQNMEQKQKPAKTQDVAAGNGKDYGVPDAVHGAREIEANKHRAEIGQQYVEMHACLSQRLEEIVQRCVEVRPHLPQRLEEKCPADLEAARQTAVETAVLLAEAALRQQLGLEAELRAEMPEYDLDEATVAPLPKWPTSHSAAWAMGRMVTAVISVSVSGTPENFAGQCSRASCRAATVPTMGHLLKLLGALALDRLIESISLQRRLGSLHGLLQRTPTLCLNSLRICLRQTGGAALGR